MVSDTPVAAPAVARVLPDVSGIDKEFDYDVPEPLRAAIAVGSLVRIDLHGRRVGGWVTELRSESDAGVALRPIAKVTGYGPPADVIELARWAAHRWAGRVRSILASASPPNAVPRVMRAPARVPARTAADPAYVDAIERHPVLVVRLPPVDDPIAVVTAAQAHGPVLVVAPSVDQARLLVARLRRGPSIVASWPRDWPAIASGAADIVVGARAAVWAPMPAIGAIVVVDEHDEALQEERVPCWHARDVALERARRTGARCVLVSPCPTLEALAAGPLVTASRNDERSGWPIVEIVDRSTADPFVPGLISEALARHVHDSGRVVCVLNRTGRARVLACRSCHALVRCERCAAAVAQTSDGILECRRCGARRPAICVSCGATRLAVVRAGVSRVRDDLEALASEPVVEVTASTADDDLAKARLIVGTEAVLHRISDAKVVAFLEFDDELLAPRYRAAEQAMALLARAARLVGGRGAGGRIVVQTRVPRHDVLDAVLRADPGRLVASEQARRAEMGFPPTSALAEISGAGAAEFAASLDDRAEVIGPADGSYLVRAPTHDALADALAGVPRPAARVRVAVDPLRA